jgi:prolyl-tRNA synthetase
MSEELGVSVKRADNFSEWYLEVVRKGNFVDQRYPLKGFDVIMPWGYAVWEFLHHEFDSLIKKKGVKNAYFPFLIPESMMKKEEEHLEGFKAEVIAATEAGGHKLEEKLFLRPTSETVMYTMFSLWIRSHNDLPFKVNQWCNVIRYDTKITKPFLRGREFLWQEGHTAHSTESDASAWIDEVVKMYKKIYDELATEPLILVRPKSDTFAGADYSVVFDTLLQDGKVAQGPGTHMLGQHFSKAFNISFTDKHGKKQHVWQTSWGMTTRQVGILIMHHGDDKGAVLPPKVAPVQVVIVPVLFKGKESAVLSECKALKEKLEKLGVRVELDEREYSAGYKFNEWELRGVPLRIELGPRDIAAKHFTVVNRLTGEKQQLKSTKEVVKMLDDLQDTLMKKSQRFLKENITNVTDLKKIGFGFSRANWCGSAECEKGIKEKSGAEVRGTMYGASEKPFDKCIFCGKNAKHVVYIAKAY